MELNRERIIKGLECCLVENNCTDCPLHHQYETDCLKYVGTKALSLIKELTEENERLRGCVKSKEEVEAIMRATYEPLVREIAKDQIDKAKADTVRKMHERLKETKFLMLGYELIYAENIDQIAKEMIGGENNGIQRHNRNDAE